MKVNRFCTMDETFGLRLENCGMEHCVPHFSMHPHQRDVYLFHYVMEGEGKLVCEGETHSFSAREIFAVFPRKIVSYHAAPKSMLKFCWFAIDGAYARELVSRAGLSKDSPICRLEEGNHMVEYVSQCIEACEMGGSQGDLLVLSLIYRMFEEIVSCRETNRRALPLTRTPAMHVARAKSYIAFNYMVALSIGDVARYIHLERTYFSRIFHEIEGISPQEYLLNYRIEIACRLLRKHPHNVKDIGEMVGIPDPYYFSRIFKKRVGMAPAAYRKSRHIEQMSLRPATP